MASFDGAWEAVALRRNGEFVDPALKPLLRGVYQAVLSQPPDLAATKMGLRHLLQFLNSEGRTNANCWAVDLFFCVSQGWERDWGDQDLPDNLRDILARMGEGLHDTVSAADIAESTGCLPEQLLNDLLQLPHTQRE